MLDLSSVCPLTQRTILARLSGGDSLTGHDLWKSGALRIDPDLWRALLKLEREGLIWRAFDYENWQTMHLWKITGCGLLRSPIPNAETIAAFEEIETGGGEIVSEHPDF